jgi:UDP:flavonoid glycosyltransferase YjiC (YdhE family)
VFVPGGGSAHPGAQDLPLRFLDAARELAASGRTVLFVAGPAFALDVPHDSGLQLVHAPSGERLMTLLAAARLVVVNGGDTLLQALVLGKPCLAVPIAADQVARVNWLQRRGAVATSAPAALARNVAQLLADGSALAQLTNSAMALGWHDQLQTTVDAMAALLDLPADPAVAAGI